MISSMCPDLYFALPFKQYVISKNLRSEKGFFILRKAYTAILSLFKLNPSFKLKLPKIKNNPTNNEIKEIFNRKLLNIIIALENQELILKNS